VCVCVCFSVESRYSGVRVFGCSGVRVFGCSGVRVFGCSGVRVFGFGVPTKSLNR
jgi:hypothetical protein